MHESFIDLDHMKKLNLRKLNRDPKSPLARPIPEIDVSPKQPEFKVRFGSALSSRELEYRKIEQSAVTLLSKDRGE